jgi:hypothetical protein
MKLLQTDHAPVPDAGGLNLKNFGCQECPFEWDAWDKAQKDIAASGGRPSLALQLLGSGYREEPWRAELIRIADEAAEKLKLAILERIKSGAFVLQGILKGDRTPVDIWPALLDNARVLNLSRSIIVADGGRKFECVRVFQHVAALQCAEAPAAAVGAQTRVAMPTRQKRPGKKGVALAAALKTHGLDREKKGHLTADIVRLVAPDLKATTAEQLDALRKAIDRHYDRLPQRKNIISISRSGV